MLAPTRIVVDDDWLVARNKWVMMTTSQTNDVDGLMKRLSYQLFERILYAQFLQASKGGHTFFSQGDMMLFVSILCDDRYYACKTKSFHGKACKVAKHGLDDLNEQYQISVMSF